MLPREREALLDDEPLWIGGGHRRQNQAHESVHKWKCSHGGHAAQDVQAANEQFLACAAELEGSPAP
jgi:hypothetical protein